MFGWLKRRPAAAGSTPQALDRQALRKEGNALLRADDLAGTADCYLRVIAQDSGDASALTSLGFIRMQQGLLSEAITYLARAVALESVGHDAHYILGALYEDKREFDLAVNHLTRAVGLAPTFDLAVRDLARVLFKAGKSTEAQVVLETGIARNAEFADYHFYLGNLQLAAGEATQAAASYARAVRIDASHVNALVQWGVALASSGALEASAAVLRRTLAIDPAHALAHGELGNLHTRLGHMEAAAGAYRASLAADPANALVAGNLGEALRVQGETGVRHGGLPARVEHQPLPFRCAQQHGQCAGRTQTGWRCASLL
jgi:protein O-GlcNAc transferase